jgi:hypothetical protein
MVLTSSVEGQKVSSARVLIAFILSLILSPAMGAEIGPHANNSAKLNAIYLKGEIKPGDSAKLREYLATLPKRRATVIYLNSEGGSFRDGINLGYVFRTEGIRTVIEGRGGKCMSACAFAFLGGFDRASGKPWRTKSSSSRLAFHSAYPLLKQASYSPEEVSELLRGGNVVASMLVTYFSEVNADWSLLGYAFKTRPSQFYDVSDNQALEIGINVYDEASKKMRYAETAKAY